MQLVSRTISVPGGRVIDDRHTRNGTLWNVQPRGSLRRDVGRADHLGPLLGIVGDELAEVGRRTLKDRYAQGRKSRLDLGISEGSIDFLVELVDDFASASPDRQIFSERRRDELGLTKVR